MAAHTPVKCMVVDDDCGGADLVGEFFTILGADVKVVYSGQQALDLAPQFQPHLVVLDLQMPAIDGFETCQRLREQAWSRDAVIVAYTGSPIAKAFVLAAGFDHLMAKGDSPATFETLLNGLAP